MSFSLPTTRSQMQDKNNKKSSFFLEVKFIDNSVKCKPKISPTTAFHDISPDSEKGIPSSQKSNKLGESRSEPISPFYEYLQSRIAEAEHIYKSGIRKSKETRTATTKPIQSSCSASESNSFLSATNISLNSSTSDTPSPKGDLSIERMNAEQNQTSVETVANTEGQQPGSQDSTTPQEGDDDKISGKEIRALFNQVFQELKPIKENVTTIRKDIETLESNTKSTFEQVEVRCVQIEKEVDKQFLAYKVLRKKQREFERDKRRSSCLVFYSGLTADELKSPVKRNARMEFLLKVVWFSGQGSLKVLTHKVKYAQKLNEWHQNLENDERRSPLNNRGSRNGNLNDEEKARKAKYTIRPNLIKEDRKKARWVDEVIKAIKVDLKNRKVREKFDSTEFFGIKKGKNPNAKITNYMDIPKEYGQFMPPGAQPMTDDKDESDFKQEQENMQM